MKQSYKKLLIFDIILIIILLLNSFISSILGTFWRLTIFLVITLIAFKLLFGYEKDNHRYIKDIIVNIAIIILASFLIFYLFGLIVGFVRTGNYYNWFGLRVFILPYIIYICLKEYLRYQMIAKADKSKLIILITIILFILIDITNNINYKNLTSSYDVFMFVAVTLLPTISRNLTATYIAKKVGYKPNIFWLLVIGLYAPLLPFVPKTGDYIGSMISFLFPLVITYNVYTFFIKRAKNIPIRNERKRNYITIPILTIFILTLVYLTSGLFRFYAVAIATGSMTPKILKGDVVIIDKKIEKSELEIGQVIAYRYNNVIIVHRLVDMVKVDNEYYFYTKGDANENMDGYIIYEDMIIGKVNHKIPYIGLPTVWLNEL